MQASGGAQTFCWAWERGSQWACGATAWLTDRTGSLFKRQPMPSDDYSSKRQALKAALSGSGESVESIDEI